MPRPHTWGIACQAVNGGDPPPSPSGRQPMGGWSRGIGSRDSPGKRGLDGRILGPANEEAEIPLWKVRAANEGFEISLLVC